MKPFNYYLESNNVRKITPNLNESRSLAEDSEKRFLFFSRQEIDEENAKFIFENIYESIREILDSFLIKNGFKSYSHQASIVYAKEKDLISQKEAIELNNLRDLRNKSKYYGKTFPLDMAKEKIELGKVLLEKIKKRIM